MPESINRIIKTMNANLKLALTVAVAALVGVAVAGYVAGGATAPAQA